MSTILLAGGLEFSGRMADPDRLAIELAGGLDTPIRIIPTAAAPDRNHERAGKNGVDWFTCLGATNVASLPIVDRTSADDPGLSEELEHAGLIYLLGGFPRYLAETLAGSRSWKSALTAMQAGAVIAGSSAGAMVACDYYFDPETSRIQEGLNLLNGICVLPHHDTFGHTWASRLTGLLPDSVLAGIDEETGVICDLSGGQGQVYGKGQLTLYSGDQVRRYGPNRAFDSTLLGIR
jgi:cyanophycinase